MNSSNANSGFSGIRSSEPMLLPNTLQPTADIKNTTVQTPEFPKETSYSFLSDFSTYHYTDPVLLQTTQEALLGSITEPTGNLKKLVGYTPIEFIGLTNRSLFLLDVPNKSLPLNEDGSDNYNDNSYVRFPSGSNSKVIKVVAENYGLYNIGPNGPLPIDIGGGTGGGQLSLGHDSAPPVPGAFGQFINGFSTSSLNFPPGIVTQTGFEDTQARIGRSGLSSGDPSPSVVTVDAGHYIVATNTTSDPITGIGSGIKVTIWFSQE